MNRHSIWINYLYVGSLSALLLFLSISRILTHEDLERSRTFFLLYSIGQALFEVACFVFVGWLINRFLPRFCFLLFIGFTFLYFLLHFLDFVLDRVMNFTIWETLDFIFDESLDNFFYLLEASGLPPWIWLVFFILLTFIPLIGILIYRITGWIATQKPWRFRLDILLQVLFCIPVALFFWDFSVSHLLHREAHQAFVKSLPWKATFLSPRNQMLALSHPLPSPKSDQENQEIFKQSTLISTKKPNIYIFIVESLRKDILTPETAPTLNAFRSQNLECTQTLSNANATHLSWFSIFHSNFPYYWKAVQERGASGSFALQLLRKMGYEIRVYSSANLSYYGMKELIFGDKGHLATSLLTFPYTPPKAAWQSDTETLDAFEKDIAHPNLQTGQCFIFFWDATHFDYSWPQKSPSRFVPIASAINYFQAYLSQETITAIKNRYKNAVHFIDGLFSRFLSTLPHPDDALIVFVGDHGEEFFEHGRLFHLSSLNDVQTQVPILFKLPRRPTKLPTLTTQMDIFPTIIDALTIDGSTSHLLEGQSLFLKYRWPYAVIARYNAGRSPYEFCIHNGQHKMIARFENQRNIFHSRALQILSLRTSNDQIFSECKHDPEGWIHSEFGSAFERLFPSTFAK